MSLPNSKVSQSISQLVSEWQGHLLSCPGQLKSTPPPVLRCWHKTQEPKRQSKTQKLVRWFSIVYMTSLACLVSCWVSIGRDLLWVITLTFFSPLFFKFSKTSKNFPSLHQRYKMVWLHPVYNSVQQIFNGRTSWILKKDSPSPSSTYPSWRSKLLMSSLNIIHFPFFRCTYSG